jgi:hypothetical protein
MHRKLCRAIESIPHIMINAQKIVQGKMKAMKCTENCAIIYWVKAFLREIMDLGCRGRKVDHL